MEKIYEIHRKYKELSEELSTKSYKQELFRLMDELKENYDITDLKACKGMAKTFYENLENEYNSL
ncbi:hypothetical protein ACWOAH_01590 [Vagococcus vulneris]|uniref:Uncharacterized protein n=1 Tax=Vagococcus vulneris TaxID=1977869 RepID=A0A430A1J2_9ENTE|nr:hypothetical protein [Vagococcus vulneris]RSU00234.1 hypothetical protein CBF37_02755 [Vagococcus vulneris]